MTDWKALAEPFAAHEVKERPGRGSMTFRYVDARAVMQRLDDVVGPEGWEFTSTVIPGTDIVHGRLIVGSNIREDYGYPNSDADDEPIKAASSDALKRCAVMFGIGRHLYDDNKSHAPRQSSGRAAPSSPARPPARSSTTVPDEPDWMEPVSNGTAAQAALTATYDAMQNDNSTCPIHGTAWNGEWGDLWHKDEDGRYCRHPENTRGPKRGRAA